MENTENKKPRPRKVNGVVTVNLLNVREQPTIQSKSIAVIKKGTKVAILESRLNSEFYKVRVDEIEGYCMKEFIEVRTNGSNQ